MKPNDKAEFFDMLNLCYEMLLRPLPSAAVMKAWVQKLEPFSIEQVRAALDAHMGESRFPPVPFDVISRIPKSGGELPEADEAWAIVQRGRDEFKTVVWTAEMQEAMKLASEVDDGDENGIRMAFRAAYNRICSEARAANRPVIWTKSLGYDVADRETVLLEAVRLGRLSIEQVIEHVPQLAAPVDDSDPSATRACKAKIDSILAAIPSNAERLARAKAEQHALEQEKLNAAKVETARRVAEYESLQRSAR